MDSLTKGPLLIASTGSNYSRAITQTVEQEDQSPGYGDETEIESNHFKSMQWSPDGTCLITNSADNALRTFIVPPDLLSPTSAPHHLVPYSTISSPEPVYAIAIYPHFTLSDPSTTLLLSSVRDHPIRLSNALTASTSPHSLTASYPLVNPQTEVYHTPSSLLFHPSGTQFYTGTDSLISVFDLSRNGSGPAVDLPTIPSKRHKMKGGGVGMRGIISCLSLQPSSDAATSAGNTAMLAAGTWTRWIGLYDAEGFGGTVANWCISAAADEDAKTGGAGVAQTLWSACGRYLFVAERKSRGILIYDVRVTGKLLGWLEGREAETNQRLAVDIFPGEEGGGSEVWAGGEDGMVRVWRGVEAGEGPKDPDWEWMAHGMAVTGCAVHSSGSVVATSSGQRTEAFGVGDMRSEDDESDEENSSDDDGDSDSNFGGGSSRIERTVDNSIKIWNLL